MGILVKNIKGTIDLKLPSIFDSWLHYWETQKGITAVACLNIECNNSADVGGHVGFSHKKNVEYILPICHACYNDRDKEFYTNEKYLVEL